MCNVAFNTVLKFLPEIGAVCEEYQRRVLVNLPCERIQCDEIWSFCYAKKKNIPEKFQGKPGYGDAWTWVAICADTKLVPCWRVGGRNAWNAQHFMYDLAERLKYRVQITTDGLPFYVDAVDLAFGDNVDFAMLVKMYQNDRTDDARYSPAECIGTRETRITGEPDPNHISTSYAERQNLTMRMKMRRLTRLSNAFSKKIDNHRHAIALHFMHYNFCRIHQTLRVTPAMEAGISDHVWSIEEVIALLP